MQGVGQTPGRSVHLGRELRRALLQEAGHRPLQRAPGPVDSSRLEQEARRMVRLVQNRQGGKATQGLRQLGRCHPGLWRGDTLAARYQGSSEDHSLNVILLKFNKFHQI